MFDQAKSRANAAAKVNSILEEAAEINKAATGNKSGGFVIGFLVEALIDAYVEIARLNHKQDNG